MAARDDRVALSVPAGGTTACMTIESALDEATLFDEFLGDGVLRPGHALLPERPRRHGFVWATVATRRCSSEDCIS